MFSLNSFYRNIKNKQLYFVECLSINATNLDVDKKMVVYYPSDNNRNIDFDTMYVREYEEFKLKFTREE